MESALGALAKCHASAELAGLEAVVTNSVFWNEWTVRIPASIGNIRVLQNLGRASQGRENYRLACDGAEVGSI